MTDITPKDRYYSAKKREIYLRWFLIAVAAVFIFLWIKGCNDGKEASVAYNKIKDTLESVLQKDASVVSEAKKMQDDISDRDLLIADLVADRDLLQGELIDKSDKSERLEQELKKARLNKDTVRIFAIADTLGFENTMLRTKVRQLVQLNKQTDSVYNIRIKKSDSLSKHWESAYIQCKNAVVVAVTELPKIEPKGKVYIDITGQVGALTAIGAGIGYMHASGRIISADYLISGHGPIYQLRLSAPLNFKRKN